MGAAVHKFAQNLNATHTLREYNGFAIVNLPTQSFYLIGCRRDMAQKNIPNSYNQGVRLDRSFSEV